MGPLAGAGPRCFLTKPSQWWPASVSESQPSAAPPTVTVVLPGPVACGVDHHTASFLSFVLTALALQRTAQRTGFWSWLHHS